MLKRTGIKRHPRKTVAIVGDGLCEQIYFQQFKEMEKEKVRSVQIQPQLPDRSGKGGGYMRVFSKAENLKKQQDYDYVFCLVDMDVVHKEKKYLMYKNQRKKMEQLGILVIECNPCFEVWFLLHFERSTRLSANCTEIERKLRKKAELQDYSKEEAYLRRKNVYQVLRNRLFSAAISNAEWLEQQQVPEQSEHFPRCEVYKVIQSLLPNQQ